MGVLCGFCYAGYLFDGPHGLPAVGKPADHGLQHRGVGGFLAVFLPLSGGGVELPDTAGAWALLSLFGLLTIALAQFLFFDALGRIEASGVAISTTAEPLVAALLATTLLGQGLAPLGWVGLGLLVIGVAGVGATLRRSRTAA